MSLYLLGFPCAVFFRLTCTCRMLSCFIVASCNKVKYVPSHRLYRLRSVSWPKVLPAAWMSLPFTSQRSSGLQDSMVGMRMTLARSFSCTPSLLENACHIWGECNKSWNSKWRYAATPLLSFFTLHSNKYIKIILFVPSQLRWRCPASLLRVWLPLLSGVWSASSVTGCWPSFSVCWSACWSTCSGRWKPSWPFGLSDWLFWTRAPPQTPRRFGWAAWCWRVSCWVSTLQTLTSNLQWRSDWATWRVDWRP